MKKISIFLFLLLIAKISFSQCDGFSVVIKAPDAMVEVDTVNVCQAAETAFQIDAQAWSATITVANWTWGDGSQISGNSVTHAYGVGGGYYIGLQVVDAVGCTAEAQFFAKVSMTPDFSGTQAGVNTVCLSSAVTLTGAVTPQTWTDGSWSFVNTYPTSYWQGNEVGQTHSHVATVNPLKDEGDQSFVFNVTDDFGCNYHSQEVILEGIEAKYSANPTSGEAMLDVSFSNESYNATDFKWLFVDSTKTVFYSVLPPDSQNNTIDYTFVKPGKYDVFLVATYATCVDTFKLESGINVKKSSLDLDIPNAFTPIDQNGVNDYLTIKSPISLRQFEMKIFNRWGKRVYDYSKNNLDNPEWKDTQYGWDGRLNGRDTFASPGAYFYVITATGYDDKNYEMRGVVYLIE